jgi:hypothetical protein
VPRIAWQIFDTPAHRVPDRPMRKDFPHSGESDADGDLPGCVGVPFVLTMPDPSRVPVLISAPHGGRAYDADLMGALRGRTRRAASGRPPDR